MSTKKKTPLPKAPPATCGVAGCTQPAEGPTAHCSKHIADCGHAPRGPHGCPLNKQGERHCDCCESCTAVCEKRAAAGIGDLCSPSCTCTPYRAPELQCEAYKRLVAEYAGAPPPFPGPGPFASAFAAASAGAPPPIPSPEEMFRIGERFGEALGPLAGAARNPRTLRYLAAMLTETARFIEGNQRAKLERFCADEGIETADMVQR